MSDSLIIGSYSFTVLGVDLAEGVSDGRLGASASALKRIILVR
jgi:hypothetical protein